MCLPVLLSKISSFSVWRRHFHSLHHKSYNPGPWSGLSMHPVEHLLYYTCTCLVRSYNFIQSQLFYTHFLSLGRKKITKVPAEERPQHAL